MAAKNEPSRPGFVLRVFAKLVLAPWVLKRVTHPTVERLLAEVAMQAARPDVAAGLLQRSALRSKGAR